MDKNLVIALEALEKMDDRKQPMLPRSEMSRIAKDAIDRIRPQGIKTTE